MNLRIAASVATTIFVLATASQAEICGDVNESGSLTSSDALLVLKGAVGQQVSLTCPSIAGLSECQSMLTRAPGWGPFLTAPVGSARRLLGPAPLPSSPDPL